MDITFVRKPVNNVWEVTLQFVNFSAAEQSRFEAFGGFAVDMGGSFSNGTSFDLPVLELSIPTQLPYKVVFSIADLGAAEANARAALWETTVEARLQSALNTFMTYDPTSGTSTRQVTLTAS